MVVTATVSTVSSGSGKLSRPVTPLNKMNKVAEEKTTLVSDLLDLPQSTSTATLPTASSPISGNHSPIVINSPTVDNTTSFVPFATPTTTTAIAPIATAATTAAVAAPTVTSTSTTAAAAAAAGNMSLKQDSVSGKYRMVNLDTGEILDIREYEEKFRQITPPPRPPRTLNGGNGLLKPPPNDTNTRSTRRASATTATTVIETDPFATTVVSSAKQPAVVAVNAFDAQWDSFAPTTANTTATNTGFTPTSANTNTAAWTTQVNMTPPSVAPQQPSNNMMYGTQRQGTSGIGIGAGGNTISAAFAPPPPAGITLSSSRPSNSYQQKPKDPFADLVNFK